MKLLAVILAVSLWLVGCGSAEQSSPRQGELPAGTSQYPPKYDRVKYFGGTWKIVRGTCDVREILLERAAGARAVDTDHDGCKDDGPFTDVYTGSLIRPDQADVDHVFPVRKFWDAHGWLRTQEEREAFYQDQNNLIAVSRAENERKSDLGPDRWRPPLKSGWCQFARVYRYAAIKYLLPVSPSEEVALLDMQAACSGR